VKKVFPEVIARKLGKNAINSKIGAPNVKYVNIMTKSSKCDSPERAIYFNN